MGPAWLYGGTSLAGAAPVKLGAQWSGDSPDQVTLTLKMDSNTGSYAGTYRSLQGIDVNVGGKNHTFRSFAQTSFDRTPYNTVSRTIYTTSTNAVTVPLTLVREMVKADYCRVRIVTDRGYEEADFTVERSQYGGAGARHYMRTFLERVDAARIEKSA